ncbi:hypothetical protein [Streptomyces phaeochromogenes]|uniref:hypothetical protein n=1 Tax=Streptomyces phaeochromogenes TaxID=1923 RepID=UPI0033DD62B5
MPDKGRRTRPWGGLRGPTPQANELAALLRDWLDRAGGMRIDDLWTALTADHFSSGRIPSRTTVADRLAGVALDNDFVEAVADVCSGDAQGRASLLLEADALRARASAPHRAGSADPLPPRHDPTAGQVSEAAELVVVQRQSLALQDRLLRAAERATELERERNNAHQMVMVLLTMVDKLHRDIVTLTAKRDRLRDNPRHGGPLQRIRERLTRSEEQRRIAEFELQRARDERQKADRLAEEAAEQTRALTAELERLRQKVPHPGDASSTPEPAPVGYEDVDAEAEDIDQALAKAARHLDDGADRLDRLAEEIQQDNCPQDNSADNLLNAACAPDNETDSDTDNPPADDPVRDSDENTRILAGEVLQQLRDIHGDSGRFGRIVLEAEVELLTYIVQFLSVEHWEIAQDFLVLAGKQRPLADIPALTAALRDAGLHSEAHQLLTTVAKTRPAHDVASVVETLRESAQEADAYQVLTAVGRERPPKDVPTAMDALTDEDAQWVLKAVERERTSHDIYLVTNDLHYRHRAAYHNTSALPFHRPEDGGVLPLPGPYSEDTLDLRLPYFSQQRDDHWFDISIGMV